VAKRCAGVIVTGHGNRDGGLETGELIEKQGGTAVARPLDVGRPGTFGEFKSAVVGPYFLTQTLLPLISDGGSVVFTSSTSALPTARPEPATRSTRA
jgi:hypothetical protein